MLYQQSKLILHKIPIVPVKTHQLIVSANLFCYATILNQKRKYVFKDRLSISVGVINIYNSYN